MIFAAILALFVFVFSNILLPFVAGMVLAYFLDPVADRLEALGLSRVMSTVLILVAFVIVLALGLVILIPILAHQLSDFAGRLPEYMTRLQGLFTSYNPEWLQQRFGVDPADLAKGVNSLLSSGVGFVTAVFASLWNSGVALFNIAGLFVVTPVVAFYMLLDWDRMVATVDSWVPRDYVETVRHLATEINRSTAGFVRGQGTLCLVLGLIYAVGLTLVGLNFGILIGIFAGSDQLHPLCRVAGRAGAVRGRRFRPVLAGLAVGRRRGLRVLLRPVRRRQHPAAPPGGQERRPAPGVADVRLVRLRRPVRLRRAADRGSGRRRRGRARPLCGGPLPAVADVPGPPGRARHRAPAAAPEGGRLTPMPDPERPRQLPLDLGHAAGRSRDDLVVSAANAKAVALVERWPDWPAPVVVLAGPAGSGKSHLGAIWTAAAAAAVLDVRSLGAEAIAAASAGPVFLDDADAADRDDAGLFHLLNAARSAGTSVLLTARRFPAAWGVGLPDLSSG